MLRQYWLLPACLSGLFVSLPASGDMITDLGDLGDPSISLAKLLKQVKMGELTLTEVSENKNDSSKQFNFFTIIGGGALVLCEPGKLEDAGPAPDGGACDGTMATTTKDGKEVEGDISDVLGFPFGLKIIKLYSDPFPVDDIFAKSFLQNGNITTENLAMAFTGDATKTGRIDYVEEGGYYDERDGKSGTLLVKGKPAKDLTAYITKGTNGNGNRLFLIKSDVVEGDLPEPSSGVLVGSIVILLGLWTIAVIVRHRIT